MFSDAFINFKIDEREARVPVFERLWQERTNYRALVDEGVPGFRAFDSALGGGQIDDAITSGVLARLRDEGLLTLRAEHLTREKLRRGVRAWSIEWLGGSALEVNRSGPELTVEDQWQRVELVVKVDADKRRIDTEFFSLNRRAGTTLAEFDDREKLHIVWEVPEKEEEPLRLVYLGLGTNEPYDTEHPERSAVGSSGRPRYYIFDADRRLEMVHTVKSEIVGRFDFNWTYRPPRCLNENVEIWYVDIDGKLISLSEEEVARWAVGMTRERYLDGVAREFNLEGPLTDEFRERVLSQINLRRTLVSAGQVRQLPSRPPVVHEILDHAARDYHAYFVARTGLDAAALGVRELLGALGRADATRWQEYIDILSWKCRDALVLPDYSGLPETHLDLVSLDPAQVPSEAADDAALLRDHYSSEIKRDLYHYGQDVRERFNFLRLGTTLAMNAAHGGAYAQALAIARRSLDSGEVYGQVGVSLNPADGAE